MRFVRFEAEGQTRFGIIQGDEVTALEASYCVAPPRLSGQRFQVDSVRLLSPAVPSKVVCVGLNYRDHIQEMGHAMPEEPCIFMKPSSAVIGPGEGIAHPPMTSRMDYEAELGVVIGKRLRNASPDAVFDAVLGYTCLNDVTARDLQAKDGQWTRAKSFDTFCPIGPCITDEIDDPGNLEIELLLNGETRQHSNTQEFVFKLPDLISFISRVMTLNPGDVIATGTPSGVGPMKVGDTVEVRIGGIGSLRNTVI